MATTKEQLDIIMSAKGAGAVESDLRRLAKSMKQTFGEESTFGMFSKMAMGGGAIAAVTMAGRMAEQISEKIKEGADALRAGTMNWGQYTESIIKSVPIMREAYNVTRNLIDAFTGQSKAMQISRGMANVTARNWTAEAAMASIATEQLAANYHRIGGKSPEESVGTRFNIERAEAAAKYEADRRALVRSYAERITQAAAAGAPQAQLSDMYRARREEQEALELGYQTRRRIREQAFRDELSAINEQAATVRRVKEADLKSEEQRIANMRLALRGKTLESELAEIERVKQARLNAIAEEEREAKRMTQDHSAQMEAELAAASQRRVAIMAAELEADQARQADAERMAAKMKQRDEEQRRIADELLGSKKLLYETEAAQGSRVAQQALKNLDVAQKYNAEIERLAQIVKNESASEAQRQQAREMMGRLRKAENAELERNAVQAYEAPRLASLYQSRFEVGIQTGAGANPQQRIADATSKMVDILSKVWSELTKLNAPAPGAVKVLGVLS